VYTNGLSSASGWAFIQHTTNISEFGLGAGPNPALYDIPGNPAGKLRQAVPYNLLSQEPVTLFSTVLA